MVFLRLEPDQPKLRRFMQRQRHTMQASYFQRIRERLLQAVQL